MKNIKIIRRSRRNTNFIAYSASLLSMLAMYATLTGTKYPTQNFCFKPKILISTDAENYCKSGETIYQTYPDFLMDKDEDLPAFGIQDTSLLIPAKGRIDKGFNPPNNPNYISYALASCFLSVSGYLLYKTSFIRYLEEFPRYFEDIKTFTFNQQLEGQKDRELKKHSIDLQVDLIKDADVRDFQSAKMQNLTPGEIEHIQKQAERQEVLDHYQHDLTVSELNRHKFANDLEAVKAQKEIEKLNKKKPIKDSTSVSQESRFEELKTRMIEELKNHENGWIFKVLNIMKPVWVIGDQGGGKSTLASSLVLLRYFLFDWELHQIIDAHAQKNIHKSWKPLKEVFKDVVFTGANNDYSAIAKAFEDSIDRWAERNEDDKPIQLLVDEFSNLSDAEDCKTEAGRFAKHSLSDPRKAAEYLILIAHYFTGTATGDKSGTNKARQSQTVQIYRKSADGKKPLPTVKINGIPDENGDIEEFNGSIPSWMMPDKIVKYFQGELDIFDCDPW